eukprot:6807912-Pyramimonas_sp.AAC.1
MAQRRHRGTQRCTSLPLQHDPAARSPAAGLLEEYSHHSHTKKWRSRASTILPPHLHVTVVVQALQPTT